MLSLVQDSMMGCNIASNSAKRILLSSAEMTKSSCCAFKIASSIDVCCCWSKTYDPWFLCKMQISVSKCNNNDDNAFLLGVIEKFNV